MSDQRMMMMMNWDGLGVDDEFLDSFDRISSARFSSAVPFNIHSSGSGSDDDDEFYDDSRMSFASAISAPPKEFLNFTAANVEHEEHISDNYDIWMAEPGSIKERRKRLLQGMGLNSNKELLKRAISRSSFRVPAAAAAKANADANANANANANETKKEPQQHSSSLPSPSPSPSPALPLELFKNAFMQSRSDGDISTAAYQDSKNRKEQLIGGVSIRKLFRSSSAPSTFCHLELPIASMKHSRIRSMKSLGGPRLTMSQSTNSDGTFFVKNLDTGKEFVVNDLDRDGMWNKLSDTQTGKQLTMEEFEQSVGHSPIVKELMRRESVVGELEAGNENNEKATTTNGQNSKSGKPPKKLGVNWLKNVANSINGFIVDKEKEQQPSLAHQTSTKSVAAPTSQWTKVRQHGKSHKELTGLYMCQEIQAHQGSIWSIRFSHDARYLASAGEDRVIHIWEVMDFDALMSRPSDEGFSTPDHPVEGSQSEDQPPVAEVQPMPQEKKKRGKSSSNKKKGSTIPDYIVVPETLFSFSEKPVFTFQGHLDDVLDLSWSTSQQLLSSSMDKTVRLWDLETKTCLKLFAHNDYVTCIQFNPIDDSYFISGSLDAKVRIWSIPDRQVVDWTDLHEMVTAACYTPDGQGAMVGSHKGTCRMYDISESKLNQKDLISVQNKKKSQAKKITGFEFDPGNPSDMLISSADSRIRIFDGTSFTQKFRGFRNTNSQISASFTADGKYVLCASEDSQVYIWKRDEIRNVVSWKGNKGFVTTQSHEHFQCKDVSVAIPWPGSVKCDPSLLSMRSKRYADLSNSRRAPTGDETTPGEEVSTSAANASNRKHLPPLPAKKNGLTEKAATTEKTAATEKEASTENAATTEKAATSRDDELADGSRVDSGISDSTSFSSASSSFKYGNSPSISASSTASSSSTRWLEDGNIQNTAWGMVIVTAGSGGEIRIYQNLGLPLRLNRQISLFRDYSLNSGSTGGNLYFR